MLTANSVVLAVSYAVSDDISVSLAQTEIEREGTILNIDPTTEHTAISASYTMGSMAVKATRADVIMHRVTKIEMVKRTL